MIRLAMLEIESHESEMAGKIKSLLDNTILCRKITFLIVIINEDARK